MWSWHHCLGHLSYGYHWKLKPHRSIDIIKSNFYYDVYELAKRHYISYSDSFNKSSEPFMIIYLDV